MTKKKNKSDIATEEASNSAENVTDDAPADEAPSEPETDLAGQLEAARAEAVENLDKFLRASAEVENIQRRSKKEINRVRKFAVEQFASELLAVHDSLELASRTDLTEDNIQGLEKMREGLALTLKQLETAFDKAAISVLDPTGEKFNPEHHQAMSMVEADTVAPHHVVDVIQKGYLLHDRLLRPAMVVVAKPPEDKAKDGVKREDDGTEA